MIKRIGGRPTAGLLDWVRASLRSSERQFPFNHPKLQYHFSARYALADGIQALGLIPGDIVLLPSYNCGIELEPFHNLGIKTAFYRINRDILVDLDHLASLLTGAVKAVLVTHYFGFPQPIEQIRELCSARGIFLIEDCAHALLSSCNGKPLGTYGDISVFSILKTLPVPNGGILIINNESLFSCHVPQTPGKLSTIFYFSDLLRQKTSPDNYVAATLERCLYRTFSQSMAAVKLMLAATRKLVSNKGLYLVRPDSYEYLPDVCRWGVSKSTKRIIDSNDLGTVIETRRRNFNQLLATISSAHPADISFPMKTLPEGTCPLFFPIIMHRDGKRDFVYQALKDKGITSHPWWDRFHPDVPWENFPDAVYLKEHLFGLPIHQDLEEKHLTRIADELLKLVAHHGA